MNRDIEIHIDELVLHGFSPHDPEGIRNAVEKDLIRLFSGQGLPSLLSLPKKLNRIDAGEFDMPTGVKAGAVGNSIAGSVYKGCKNHKNLFKK